MTSIDLPATSSHREDHGPGLYAEGLKATTVPKPSLDSRRDSSLYISKVKRFAQRTDNICT